MLYRDMRGTGDAISILGFGLMRLPGTNTRIDDDRAAEMILRAVDRGINYFDTAVPYHAGQSEPLLGKVLEESRLRDRVFIATKLTPFLVKTPEEMDRLLLTQLGNLRTDRIDYYLAHGLERRTWDDLCEMGALDFLDVAKRDGRIRSAGFSFHGDRETFREIVDAYDWDFCQIQYNYLDRENQAGEEGLNYAARRGLSVVVMEPLRGGLLAGDVPESVAEAWDGLPTRRTPVEWALRWLWDRPEVTSVLSGMSTMEQLEENLRIADGAEPGTLSTVELAAVDRAAVAFRSLMRIGCTGCRYCMPCPYGVDIPGVFEIFNSAGLQKRNSINPKFLYAFRMGGAKGQTGYASQCTACGHCEKHCPQHLEIIDGLREARREMEGPLTRPLAWMMRRVMGVMRAKVLSRH